VLDNPRTIVGLEPHLDIGKVVPYPDNFFDIVLSFNASDHKVTPTKTKRDIGHYAIMVIFSMEVCPLTCLLVSTMFVVPVGPSTSI
jgi:hypothetical protein